MKQLTIARRDYDTNFRLKSTSDAVIHATTEDELFEEYFRNYDNRFKYCNSVQTRIVEPDMAEKYRVWVSDINNYANNGGDMW